jgi:hypothetical protein
MLSYNNHLAYRLLIEHHDESPYSRERIMQDLAYAISLGSIPILAIIICFIVTWIWGD